MGVSNSSNLLQLSLGPNETDFSVIAKYCNEHVCVCVCVCRSVRPRAYLPNHTRNLYQFLLHGRGSVLLRRGNEIPREMGNLGKGFFPIDNALYSIAFGTHNKTAEPIEMPFELMT